jgi:hypothetical protein
MTGQGKDSKSLATKPGRGQEKGLVAVLALRIICLKKS